MAKVSRGQIHEFGLRIQRGQIPTWKIPAVFGIVEDDPLGTYLRFVEEARRQIISAEEIQALIESKDKMLRIFKVTVDYELTLKQMVKATRLSPDVISKRFDVRGNGRVEREVIVLFGLEGMTTKALFVEMKRRGLRPAKVEDLLALLAQFPGLHMSGGDTMSGAALVALGSYTYDNPYGRSGDALYFPALDEHESILTDAFAEVRGLSLEHPQEDGSWYDNRLFLAVRKDAA